MTKQSTPINRRSFLKSSALAGGGLMLSFSWLSAFKSPVNPNDDNLPEQWNELTGYIKITPDSIIKIYNPNPEFGQNVMTTLPMIIFFFVVKAILGSFDFFLLNLRRPN